MLWRVEMAGRARGSGIVVGPDDDDARTAVAGAALGGPDGDDLDDGDDPDDDDLDEDDDPGAASIEHPEVAQLREANAKLQAAVSRNNRELAQRRQVDKWMKRFGITDLEGWLAQIGVDPATAQKPVVVSDPLADAREQVADDTNPAAPDAADVEPGLGSTPDQVPAAVREHLAKAERESAQRGERVSALEEKLRDAELRAALGRLKFNGTFEKALLLMDLDRVAVGPDGTVTGADEAAQGVREEIPEWFKVPPPPPPRTTGPIDAGDRPRAPARQQTWEQRVAGRWQQGR